VCDNKERMHVWCTVTYLSSVLYVRKPRWSWCYLDPFISRSKTSFLDLFRTPNLRRITIMVIILWMLTSLVFDASVRSEKKDTGIFRFFWYPGIPHAILFLSRSLTSSFLHQPEKTASWKRVNTLLILGPEGRTQICKGFPLIKGLCVFILNIYDEPKHWFRVLNLKQCLKVKTRPKNML
jgi:hypothetical protein